MRTQHHDRMRMSNEEHSPPSGPPPSPGATRTTSSAAVALGVHWQLAVMDNAVGEEGAAALTGLWTSAHVTTVLGAVLPGYPEGVAPLFVRPTEADRALLTSIGYAAVRVGRPTCKLPLPSRAPGRRPFPPRRACPKPHPRCRCKCEVQAVEAGQLPVPSPVPSRPPSRPVPPPPTHPPTHPPPTSVQLCFRAVVPAVAAHPAGTHRWWTATRVACVSRACRGTGWGGAAEPLLP